ARRAGPGCSGRSRRRRGPGSGIEIGVSQVSDDRSQSDEPEAPAGDGDPAGEDADAPAARPAGDEVEAERPRRARAILRERQVLRRKRRQVELPETPRRSPGQRLRDLFLRLEADSEANKMSAGVY